LRYLGLAANSIRELPMEIGDLRSLQILDLTDNPIEALPQSVTLLRELKSLLCYYYDWPVKLPDGMGSLTSLEELRLYLGDEDNSSDLSLADFVKELGKLTELRVLHIKTFGFSRSLNKALVESLNKLKKMEELDIYKYGDGDVDEDDEDDDPTPTDSWDDYSPCQLLRHLRLCSTEMPEWIKINTSLGNISYLNLSVTSFTPWDLGHLGRLPELRSLALTCNHDLHGVVVAADGDAFPKLRYFQTNCSLRYVQGAMRCLESLTMILTVGPDVEFDFDSLQCLHSLEILRARILCFSKTTERLEAARAALKRAVDNHPNRPILEF